MCCADWVQHVIDTEGEPYLHTPEDSIPLASLLLLDVFALLAVATAAPLCVAWAICIRLLGRRFTAKSKTA